MLFYIKIISLANYCRVFIPKYNKRISPYIYLTENLKTHTPGTLVRVKINDSSLILGLMSYPSVKRQLLYKQVNDKGCYPSVPAHRLVKHGAIFFSHPLSSPLHSTPLRSAQLHSSPLRSAPLRSAPSPSPFPSLPFPLSLLN